MSIRKDYVDTPLGQIHYLSSGEGTPLVLLHQTSDAATMWEPVLPVFADLGYWAVAIDIPGHGQSDPPPEQPDGLEYARRIDEATRLLGMETYHVLGHHFGSTVALWVAAEYPDRVDKVVMYGFSQVGDENERYPYLTRKNMQNAQPRTFGRDGSEIKEAWIKRWDMSGMLLPEGVDSHYNSDMARRTMIARLQVGPYWYYAYQLIGNTDEATVAARVQAPTLITCGPRDHFFEENRTTGAGLFPNGRFAEIKDAGVDVADEYPHEFCRIVDEFLREPAS